MPLVRPATDADSDGVIALIARAYAEYPGCVLDVDEEEPELRRPESSFDRFWVLESDGAVGGCIGCTIRDDHVELSKLYLDEELRGRGHAEQLVELVEETARGHGREIIEFWSDTRFTRAHAFYARLGYVKTGKTRDLHDRSNSTEYRFRKKLG